MRSPTRPPSWLYAAWSPSGPKRRLRTSPPEAAIRPSSQTNANCAGSTMHSVDRGRTSPARTARATTSTPAHQLVGSLLLADERRLGEVAADLDQELRVRERPDRAGTVASRHLLQPRRTGGGAARTPPTAKRPPPGTPSSTAPAATRSPRAPRQRRASLLLQQRPQDVDLELELADLPLRTIRRRAASCAGRDFRPSRPAARNSSRQPAILPTGCPVSRASRSSDSPRSSAAPPAPAARAPAHLTARLRLTARHAGARPRHFSIRTSRTPDIATSSV